MELSFYQTFDGNLVSSAVRLLEKIYMSEKRCVVHSPIDDRLSVVDKALWTFSTNAFIPHGGKETGMSDVQPIFFSKSVANPNAAVILMLIDSFDYQQWSEKFAFERVLFIFEDALSIKNANDIYDGLQKKQEHVNYWQQSKSGWTCANVKSNI